MIESPELWETVQPAWTIPVPVFQVPFILTVNPALFDNADPKSIIERDSLFILLSATHLLLLNQYVCPLLLYCCCIQDMNVSHSCMLHDTFPRDIECHVSHDSNSHLSHSHDVNHIPV